MGWARRSCACRHGTTLRPFRCETLQELWDRNWSKSGRMFLILCGSYIGFMEREVLLHSYGGAASSMTMWT